MNENREAFKACNLRADPPVRLTDVTEHTSKLTVKITYLSQKGENWLATYKRLLDIKQKAAAAAAAKAKAEAEAKANQTATGELI